MDLERAAVLSDAVGDDEPGVPWRACPFGAGGCGGALLLLRDPSVGLLELLLLDASQEVQQLKTRNGIGHVFDSMSGAPEGAERVS